MSLITSSYHPLNVHIMYTSNHCLHLHTHIIIRLWSTIRVRHCSIMWPLLTIFYIITLTRVEQDFLGPLWSKDTYRVCRLAKNVLFFAQFKSALIIY